MKIREIINYCDGDNDLLRIAEIRGYKMLDMINIRDNLIKAGYLVKNK